MLTFVKDIWLTCFCSEKKLPWPVNNFIKQSSLAEYSKVTTLLLRLKRAKHILERHMLFESQHDMRLYSLRMKLVWFVNTFWGYVMTTVEEKKRKSTRCREGPFLIILVTAIGAPR